MLTLTNYAKALGISKQAALKKAQADDLVLEKHLIHGKWQRCLGVKPISE
jgi:hypothetical protein